MKIGPTGWCDFLEESWDEYYPYGSQYVTNLWKPGECPVPLSHQVYNDFIVDAEMFPKYMSPGLWRLTVTLSKDEKAGLETRFLVKVYENGYFG